MLYVLFTSVNFHKVSHLTKTYESKSTTQRRNFGTAGVVGRDHVPEDQIKPRTIRDQAPIIIK
jgi:hypothetical protein